MTVEALLPSLAGVVLVALVAAFALLPLAARRGLPPPPPVAEDPGAQRLAIYRQVLDLEFDHQTGKLGAADYQALSQELLAQAALLLRAESGTPTTPDAEVDAAVEAEIASARRALAALRSSSAQEVTT